jgi:hypothetical protein
MKEYTEENAREEVRDYHAFLDEKDRQVERLPRDVLCHRKRAFSGFPAKENTSLLPCR